MAVNTRGRCCFTQELRYTIGTTHNTVSLLITGVAASLHTPSPLSCHPLSVSRYSFIPVCRLVKPVVQPTGPKPTTPNEGYNPIQDCIGWYIFCEDSMALQETICLNPHFQPCLASMNMQGYTLSKTDKNGKGKIAS